MTSEPATSAQGHEAEQDGDNGVSQPAMPVFLLVAQFAEFVAQAQDDIVEFGVVACRVSQVILAREAGKVGLLQGTAFGLIRLAGSRAA